MEEIKLKESLLLSGEMYQVIEYSLFYFIFLHSVVDCNLKVINKSSSYLGSWK